MQLESSPHLLPTRAKPAQQRRPSTANKYIHKNYIYIYMCVCVYIYIYTYIS